MQLLIRADMLAHMAPRFDVHNLNSCIYFDRVFVLVRPWTMPEKKSDALLPFPGALQRCEQLRPGRDSRFDGAPLSRGTESWEDHLLSHLGRPPNAYHECCSAFLS